MARYMGTILNGWERALISPHSSSSMACFAISLCLLLAVHESGRKKECFLARGSFCCLGDCCSAISEKLRALIHHHPGSPGGRCEAQIWFSIERHPQTQPRTTGRGRHLLQEICFLAIIQHLNIHQKCSCAAARMSPFICSYLSEDCFSMFAHWLWSACSVCFEYVRVFLQDKASF